MNSLKKNSTLTRGEFIKINGLTLAGLMIGLNGCGNTIVLVKGHVYDMLGFPVEGALISFVTGYSLKADDGLQITSTLVGPISTDALGSFQISFANPNQDVACRVTFQNAVQRIVVREVTGTSIPFYEAEVWSPPDRNKWINDLHDEGLLNNLNIYIDPSRTYIRNYFSKNHSELLNLLENNYSGEGEEAWEGNHLNPDNPGQCNSGCDDHYASPKPLDRTRKINLPWGIGPWGVIPFVNAEGFVFQKSGERSNESNDGDWEWDIVLEPQYSYLPNEDNTKLNGYEPQTHKELALHCEMCNWFMGRKNNNQSSGFEPSKTNIARSNSLSEFKNNKRVWVLGSWTVDDGHHDLFNNPENLHNEIHPIYWVVPFIGGWRRFYASELIRLGIENGAQSFINAVLSSSPQSLLDTLTSTFYLVLSSKANHSRSDAEAFYIKSILHLNKFGLNYGFPNGVDNIENSIAAKDFSIGASIMKLEQMKTAIAKKYNRIFIHLTSLGSGVFVFPIMIFAYEGTNIIQHADSYALQRPLGLNTSYNSRIQISLAKQALRLGEDFSYNGLILLKFAYAEIFNTMKDKNISSAKIADYYATTSVRLISYGIYEDDNPQHSNKYQDHYDWALQNAISNLQWLIDSINVRIDSLWNDSFPFTRKQ